MCALKKYFPATRVITFDAIHTLYYPTEPIGKTYSKILKANKVVVDEALITKSFPVALERLGRSFPCYGVGSMDAFEWWKRVIERTWFLGGVHPSSIEKFIDSASEELFEHFSGSSGFSLYEDTIPTLQELYTNKYKLGIITNSDNRTKQVVKSFGLDRYFSFIITGESMQLQKPDPKLYSAAVENKYIPQQVCHIGDDLFGDYLASSKAGFNSILLDRKRKASSFNDAENVVKITSLTELV